MTLFSIIALLIVLTSANTLELSRATSKHTHFDYYKKTRGMLKSASNALVAHALCILSVDFRRVTFL